MRARARDARGRAGERWGIGDDDFTATFSFRFSDRSACVAGIFSTGWVGDGARWMSAVSLLGRGVW